MKFHPVLLAFLFGFGTLPLAAETETVPPTAEKSSPANGASPNLLQVQVEFIELSHEALTKLLFLAEPKTAGGTLLRKQLQEMVGRNEAKVLETQIVVAKSGQKATSESIHEFIYPTEYEPPSLPCGTPADDRSSVAPGEHALPTAFDTRNLGSTLEVESTLSPDEKLVELRLVPELVWHTGNTTYLETKDALGNVSKVEMPDIYVVRLNTSVTSVVGQYLMAGVLSPKDAKGEADMSRKVMVFVKCDLLPTP